MSSSSWNPNPILSSTQGQPDTHSLDPPHLSTPLASEPADQWASNTLVTISNPQSQSQSDPTTSFSTASTPGPFMPGAYPGGHPIPSKGIVQTDVELVKDAALSALENAKDYIVAGGQKLYPYAMAAGETAYSTTAGAGSTFVEGTRIAAQRSVDGAVAAKDSVVGGAGAATDGAVSGTVAAKDAVVGGAARAKDASVDGALVAEDAVAGGAVTAKDIAVAGAATARDTAVGGAGAATGTVSSGATNVTQKVYSIAETAKETVAPYLPAAIVSYLPGSTENASHGSTAVTDPTGNMKNGLEALDGTSFAKLPEEAQADNSLHGGTRTAVAAHPTSQAGEQDSTHLSLPASTRGGADTDASTKTLHGSLLAGLGPVAGAKHEGFMDHRHIGTSESKPLNEADRSHGEKDTHVKKLNQHEALHSEHQTVEEKMGQAMKDKEDRYHAGVGVEGALGHGANKPVNTDGRTRPLGAPESRYQRAASEESPIPPSVPPKGDDPSRGDSTTAQVGHALRASSASEDAATSPRVAIDQHSTHTAKDRAHGGRHGSEGSNGRKVGFMSKVKGEMKVISGKVARNEEKVEEGRRMMGKN